MHRALLLLLALALPALVLPASVPPALAATPEELPRLPAPIGTARLVKPVGVADPPLVIMLPDALGEDGRSETYVGSLLARGIASLVLGLDEDLDANPAPVDPAASPAAVPVALAWARASGFMPEATGVLGFGLGGRAALAGAGGLPTVALYPGCAALPEPSGPALVLQGGDAAASCGDIVASAGMALRLIPGAGHAWDAPGAIWPSPGPVLPDPAGGGLLRSRTDHDVTLQAAEAVADWFEATLLAGARRAAR